MRLAVSVLCAVALIVPAVAVAATGAQVRQLAARAESSSSALEQLRSIHVVDGRPVDLRRALATRSRTELHARLRTLAAGRAAASPTGARDAAHSILRDRRFRGSAVPRPFHGALVWLGRELRPVGRAFAWLAGWIPGGDWALWAILAGAVVLAAGLVATSTARRRGGAALEQHARARLPAGLDPGRLERDADAAESAGDAELALRLRFRAGLMRLGRARVVPMRESLTSGEARRILRLGEFDALARTHDEVVYGGRAARLADATAARERWAQVLAAKGVRP